MKHYYQLLGLDEHATIEQVKKAYRQKAKQLHPDVNKSPTAHADFIAVNHAYEYIINQKLGINFNSTQKQYTQTSTAQEWGEQQRRQAEERARKHAQMKYKEFINSKYYKEQSRVLDFVWFAEVIFYVLFILGIPLIIALNTNIAAMLLSPLFALLSATGWRELLKRKRTPSWQNIKQGFKIIANYSSVRQFVSILFFACVFFFIGFRTFITIYDFIMYVLILLVLILISQVTWRRKFEFKLITTSLISSLLISATLLLVNYLFSFGEKVEIYDCGGVVNTYIDREHRQRSRMESMIELEDGIYQGYPSVRFFVDVNDVPVSAKVCYITKNGLLNYKVYTKRYFQNKNLWDQ